MSIFFVVVFYRQAQFKKIKTNIRNSTRRYHWATKDIWWKNLTVLTSFSPSWTAAAAVVATSFQPRPPQAWLPGFVALQAMPLRFHELLQTILCFRVFSVSNHFHVAICQCRHTSPFRRAWHTFPRHSHSFFLSAWESRQWRLWYWSWSVPVGDFWRRSFPGTIKNKKIWLLKKGPKRSWNRCLKGPKGLPKKSQKDSELGLPKTEKGYFVYKSFARSGRNYRLI